jgi:hypothetical protein
MKKSEQKELRELRVIRVRKENAIKLLQAIREAGHIAFLAKPSLLREAPWTDSGFEDLNSKDWAGIKTSISGNQAHRIWRAKGLVNRQF